MQNSIIIFIHVASAAVALGSSVYVLWVLLPRIRKQESNETLDEKSVSYQMIDLLAPTVFASLLLLVGSGVYYLMANYTDQVNLKDGYYNVFGIKLVFVVAAFLMSAHQTFILKPQIADLDLRPELKKNVPQVLGKMISVGRGVLMTTAIAVFMGIYLARF